MIPNDLPLPPAATPHHDHQATTTDVVRLAGVAARARHRSAKLDPAERLALRCRDLESRIADLERLNQKLARIAAETSHDLRAPLQVITTCAELIAGQAENHLDQPAQHLVTAIVTTARDMGHLMDSVMEWAETTASRRGHQRVDCGQLVEQAIFRLQPEIERTGTSIEVGDLPVVDGDPVQLLRVFQNLLANACKSAPAGRSARVVVSARPTPQGWELSVADDGRGVPPEDAQRIFRLYQRGRDSLGGEGRGLGLAICKSIVEHHGGHIRVEPVAQGGSRFVFFLPTPG